MMAIPIKPTPPPGKFATMSELEAHYLEEGQWRLHYIKRRIVAARNAWARGASLEVCARILRIDPERAAEILKIQLSEDTIQ
jgi:hypothetical protein